jgi:hypothetical protein
MADKPDQNPEGGPPQPTQPLAQTTPSQAETAQPAEAPHAQSATDAPPPASTPSAQPTDPQPAQLGAEAPPPVAAPSAKAPRRPPQTIKTWVAAAVAAGLLVVGGVGGYFIGAAGDGHRGGPGWHDQGRGPGDGFDGDMRWRDGNR